MLLLLCPGNENIHRLTNNGRIYVLRIDIEDWIGNKRFATYDHFRVGNEASEFKLLSVGSYNGTAGK